MRGELAAELLGEPAARLDEASDVDAGLDPKSAAHPREVLGSQIAAGHLGEWRAAHPSGARVEDGDPFRERRERVRQRLPIRVVQVERDPVDAHAGIAVRGDQRQDLAGRANTDRVAERELVASDVEEMPPGVDRDCDRRGTVPWIRDDHREVTAHA